RSLLGVSRAGGKPRDLGSACAVRRLLAAGTIPGGAGAGAASGAPHPVLAELAGRATPRCRLSAGAPSLRWGSADDVRSRSKDRGLGPLQRASRTGRERRAPARCLYVGAKRRATPAAHRLLVRG